MLPPLRISIRESTSTIPLLTEDRPMAYLTFEEYRKLSPQSKVSEADFEVLSSIAEDVIDAFTFHAIPRYGLIDDEAYRDDIEKAVVRQVDFIVACGGAESYVAMAGVGETASESVTVGNTSESRSYVQGTGGLKATMTEEGLRLAPLAVIPLRRIQAIGRQVGRCTGA